MTPEKREKLVKRCAKAMARAEWRSFQTRAEAHVQALMIDPNAAPHLEGPVKFKFHKGEQP